MIVERKAIPIKVTTSGIAVERPCRLVGFSVLPGGATVTATFHDGSGSGATDKASGLAVATVGSYSEHFTVPINFDTKLYVNMSDTTSGNAVYMYVLDGTGKN